MEIPFTYETRGGNIPVFNRVTKLSFSPSGLLAIALESSIYLYSSFSSSLPFRVHHSSTVKDQNWSSSNILGSIDSSHKLFVSDFSLMSSYMYSTEINIHSVSWCGHKLLLFSDDEVLLFCPAARTIEMSFSGIKAIGSVSDYVFPTRLILYGRDSISVIRDYEKAPSTKVFNTADIQDIAIHPYIFNTLIILHLHSLDFFDINSMKIVKTFQSGLSFCRIFFISLGEMCIQDTGILHTFELPRNFAEELQLLNTVPISTHCICIHPLHDSGKRIAYIESYSIHISGFLNINDIQKIASFMVGLPSTDYFSEDNLYYSLNQTVYEFDIESETVINQLQLIGEITHLAEFNDNVYIVQLVNTRYVLLEWNKYSKYAQEIKEYEFVDSIEINQTGNKLAILLKNFIEIIDIKNKQFYPIQQTNNIRIVAIEWAYKGLVMAHSKGFSILKWDRERNVYNFYVKQYFLFRLISNITAEGISIENKKIYLKYNKEFYFFDNGSAQISKSFVDLNVPTIVKKNRIRGIITEFEVFFSNQVGVFQLVENLEPDEHLKTILMNDQLLNQLSDHPLSGFLSTIPDSIIDRARFVSKIVGNTDHFILWMTASLISARSDQVERPEPRGKSSSPGMRTPGKRESTASVSSKMPPRPRPSAPQRGQSATPKQVRSKRSSSRGLMELAAQTLNLFSASSPRDCFYFYMQSANYIKDLESQKSTDLSVSNLMVKDHRDMYKNLVSSTNESEVLFGCILAGTISHSELVQALQIAQSYVKGNLGDCLRYLVSHSCESVLHEEEAAYFHKANTGEDSQIVQYLGKLFRGNHKWPAVVHLLGLGYYSETLGLLCSMNELSCAIRLAGYFEEIGIIAKGSWRYPSKVLGPEGEWIRQIIPFRFGDNLHEDLATINAHQRNLIDSIMNN